MGLWNFDMHLFLSDRIACFNFRKGGKYALLSSVLNIEPMINTTGVTNGSGSTYPSGAPELIPDFQWGSCYSIFSFICMFCRSLVA